MDTVVQYIKRILHLVPTDKLVNNYNPIYWHGQAVFLWKITSLYTCFSSNWTVSVGTKAIAIAVDIGCSPITALISFSYSLQFHPSIKRPEVRYHMKKNLIQYNLVGARNMRIMGGLEFWVWLMVGWCADDQGGSGWGGLHLLRPTFRAQVGSAGGGAAIGAAWHTANLPHQPVLSLLQVEGKFHKAPQEKPLVVDIGTFA